MNGSEDRSRNPRTTPFVRFLSGDSDGYVEILGRSSSVAMRSGLVTLQPGRDVGVHSTENYEELILVLCGQGEVEANGLGRKKISANYAVYIPPNTSHNVFNVGSEPLRYIYVVAPALGLVGKFEK